MPDHTQAALQHKGATPLNPSLLEGDVIPKAKREAWGGGVARFLLPVDIQSAAALIHQIRWLLIISIH